MGSMGGDAPEIEETELEKQTADIAWQKFNTLKKPLQEAEDYYFTRVQGMNDSAEFTKLANSIDVATGNQFDKTGRAVAEDMAARNIDPSSGRFKGTLNHVSQEAGRVSADALNRGQTSLQDNALSGMGNLVAMGEGESAKSLDGMMEVAATSSAYAKQKASEQAQKRSNRQGTLAFMAGAGYEIANGNQGGDE